MNETCDDHIPILWRPFHESEGVCATGCNVIDLDAAGRHGVTVTNVPAYSTESVTQLTWGFILECASRMSLHNDSVHRGDWIASESFCYWLAPVTELAGKTLGIVGYGNIGRRVAEVAKAFRMKVLIFTAHPEKYEKMKSQSVTGAAEFVSFEMAWASVEARTRLVQTVADNCRSWLEGKGQNVL